MQQKQVLDLIQTVVKPLRQKIDFLQKQNQKLRTQISIGLHYRQEYPRKRSMSKQDKATPKKNDHKEIALQNSKEKDKKIQRPIWNHPKANKTEPIQIKSPPPKDKNGRINSKDKVQVEKRLIQKDGEKKMVEVEKRIVGGKKVELVKKEQVNNVELKGGDKDKEQ